MELMVACRRHRHGGGLWCDFPVAVVQRRQPMGTTGCLSVSVWYDGLIRGLNGISRPTLALEMARTVPQVGPCRHLLAHSGFVFATDTGSTTHPRLLGMVAVHVCVGLRHCGYHCQFHQTEGALQRGDLLLHRHGTERTGSLQALDRQRLHSSLHLDCRRGSLLHHRCTLLLTTQEEVYALRVPLLRLGRFRLSYHRRLGRIDGIFIIILLAVWPKMRNFARKICKL